MSNRPCANDFDDLIQIEQHSGGISTAATIVGWMVESRKGGRFVHYQLEGFPQWQTLCALEDALIDNDVNEGWEFVVGRIADMAEVRGWMEYDGWVVVPYGPEQKQSGSDIGVWSSVDFTTDVEYDEWARADAAPESGIVLNAWLKQTFHLGPDESLGEAT